MTKERTTITIDSELLKKSKKQIPNLSAFIENCIKTYLGETETLVHTHTMQELVQTISKCQLELYLMNERNNIEEAKQKAALHEINFAWRKIFADFRDTRKIQPHNMERAIEVLKVPEEELRDIVEVAYAFSRTFTGDITEWEDVYKEFGSGDE